LRDPSILNLIEWVDGLFANEKLAEAFFFFLLKYEGFSDNEENQMERM
jgi:hypothetical protein